jgi:acetylcholinesterase
MSAALQMVTDTGKLRGSLPWRVHGVRRGESPVGDIQPSVNEDYDDLVRESGCAGAEDTLECLRQAPFATLK